VEILQLEANPLFYCGNIWQEDLNAGHLIWIQNQAFVLVGIIFSGYVAPHKLSGI